MPANHCEKGAQTSFFLLKASIAFGHIYFTYTKEYITNQISWSNAPQYICYDERLYGEFLSSKISISFNHTVCRHSQDYHWNWSHQPLHVPLYFTTILVKSRRMFLTATEFFEVILHSATATLCINVSTHPNVLHKFDSSMTTLIMNYKDDEIQHIRLMGVVR